MIDAKRAANLKRRLSMIRYHSSQRDPISGKSVAAMAAGRAGWRVRAERAGGGRALGLELALARHYPEKEKPPRADVAAAQPPEDGSDGDSNAK